MKNHLVRILITAWFAFFFVQTSISKEVDANEVKTAILETFQDSSLNRQQRMELYIDLYDVSDNMHSKHMYINEALKLAIQLNKQDYIFEILDIFCRDYKSIPDSLSYYQEIGEKYLQGPYKKFCMAWLKAFPSVCKMDEAEKPDEANEEISRYKHHKKNLSDKSQEVLWEMILCSAMECINYFSPSVSNAKERIAHLKNIHQLVARLPFEVRYKFEWYYLTRIEFIFRAEGKPEDIREAVATLEELEQLYDQQFELPFYKKRNYIGTRSREALRMGVYSELFYFADYIGRKRVDEIYSRMKEFYKEKDPEKNEDMLLLATFRYNLYTKQYELAMHNINELLVRTDTADTNGRTELLAKKINLVTQWKQHYKDGFEAFWEYTNLMEENHIEETNRQLAEMRSLYDVDKLKIERAELQTRYHRIALIVALVLLFIFFVWIIYQYRLMKRLEATKQALILSNKKVAEESERAKVSDRMKTEFLQSMCHEIRTPLNAICGFSSLLLNDDLTEEDKKDFPGIIEKNSVQLTALFENILQVSDLSSSLELFPVERTDIFSLCVTLLDTFRTRADNSKVKYIFENKLSNCLVKTNSYYLQRVLMHLLNNSEKFTTTGHISMCLEQVDAKIRISVSDTGIGIPADKAEYIFDRFTKLDEFTSGTGLGLYSCRLIMNRLGGSIFLDISYKKGARFCVDLPLGQEYLSN